MTESKREATHTEIAGAARQLSRDPAAQAHDLRGALKGLLNVYDEIRTAHPEAQGNKDLGEPRFALEQEDLMERPILEEMAAAEEDANMRVVLAREIDKTFLTTNPAPTSPPPIKGESELESASNGMGLR